MVVTSSQSPSKVSSVESPRKTSRCPHVATIGFISSSDFYHIIQSNSCNTCGRNGPHLWFCLREACLYVGCGSGKDDHSGDHEKEKAHPLQMNITTRRIWCYSCNEEVLIQGNDPPFDLPFLTEHLLSSSHQVTESQQSPHPSDNNVNIQSSVYNVINIVQPSPLNQQSFYSTSKSSSYLNETDETFYRFEPTLFIAEALESNKPQLQARGLLGLYNLGNTCYMNAALQALSNCIPLTSYFLDCSNFIQYQQSKPTSTKLTKCYLKFCREMWSRRSIKDGYSSMNLASIAAEIRYINPSFRSYTQQDAQEFLRCFMDQLHEEMRQDISNIDKDNLQQQYQINSNESSCDTSSSCATDSQNEQIQKKLYTHLVSSPSKDDSTTEYETCDSLPSSCNDSLDELSPIQSPSSCSLNEFIKKSTNSSSPYSKFTCRRSSRHTIQTNLSVSRTDSGVSLNTNGPNQQNNNSSSSMTTLTPQTQNNLSPSLSATPPLIHNVYSTKTPSTTVQQDENIDDNLPRYIKYEAKQPSKCVKPRFQSIISSIFDGRILSQIECLTCYRRSSTIETFQDLSLPIPSKEQLENFRLQSAISSSNIQQSSSLTSLSSIQIENNNSNSSDLVKNQQQSTWFNWFYSIVKNLWSYNIWGPTLTLQDCLSAFFSADELTGDNMYSCEKCGKLRNGMKYCKILELPEILCIHLKRFRHDSLVYTKISTYVTFPLFDLDMKQFLHKDCKNDVYMYNLLSCIVHYGRAGGGHYTTYSLNSINNEWYEFDDNEVRKVDAAQVQNADAYILFYRKKESNITDTYDNIRHLLDNDQNRLLPFYISKSWINRLFYFAEPGPITNNDFLCKHGGVLPNYWSVIKNLVYPAPETVWEYLYRKFGGGPVCNILYPCRKCQLDEENLKRRQRYEKATFLELKRNESDSHAVYALSPTWFRDWENFVCEKSSNPPGPISNQGISVTKNGISKPSKTANCRQLSEKIWNFLYETYGGGPVLLIRSNSSYSMINNALTTTESNNNNNNNNNNIDDISSQETTATTKPPVTFV